jgi:hypothetical protein
MRATFLPPAAAEAAMTAAMWRSKYCWSPLLGASPSCCSAAPAGQNKKGAAQYHVAAAEAAMTASM